MSEREREKDKEREIEREAANEGLHQVLHSFQVTKMSESAKIDGKQNKCPHQTKALLQFAKDP